MLVLLGRCFIRSKRGYHNIEHDLFLKNLAASDLLMGVYLSIIATTDIQFRGEYLLHDLEWRQSFTCSLCGFLSTLSCQSSTLILSLVTWDRLICVTRPLQPRSSSKVSNFKTINPLACVAAASPFLYENYFGAHFYGNNGVCLSVHIHDPFSKGWEYSACLFIFVNTMALLFIVFSYAAMLKAIRGSGEAMRSTVSGRENAVARRFAIIVATDCACWLPIIVVKLVALNGVNIPASLYAWLAVFVLPVNSALNPVLYTLTTAAFKQQDFELKSCICLSDLYCFDRWLDIQDHVLWYRRWPSNWEHGSDGPIYDNQIYRCDVTVERSENLTSLVGIVGNHLEGKNISDIERIRINNSSTFTRIPSNIGNLLPRLIGIDFRAELITSLTAEDLKQFPNITFLAIYDSQIVSLDGNLFKYTPHLQALVIPSNKIVNVGPDLLKNLVDLKLVNFRSNPCLCYYASNPQQLNLLKSNLSLSCPPILTAISAPTSNILTSTMPTPPTPPTVSTSTIQTTPSIPTPNTTLTVPVENCEIRCSLNEETDELKSQLIKQGALIRDLYEIVSNYSHRIFELEKFNAKITNVVNSVVRFVHDN